MIAAGPGLARGRAVPKLRRQIGLALPPRQVERRVRQVERRVERRAGGRGGDGGLERDRGQVGTRGRRVPRFGGVQAGGTEPGRVQPGRVRAAAFSAAGSGRAAFNAAGSGPAGFSPAGSGPAASASASATTRRFGMSTMAAVPP